MVRNAAIAETIIGRVGFFMMAKETSARPCRGQAIRTLQSALCARAASLPGGGACANLPADAKVAELADAPDLGSGGATHEGSTPSFRTTTPAPPRGLAPPTRSLLSSAPFRVEQRRWRACRGPLLVIQPPRARRTRGLSGAGRSGDRDRPRGRGFES